MLVLYAHGTDISTPVAIVRLADYVALGECGGQMRASERVQGVTLLYAIRPFHHKEMLERVTRDFDPEPFSVNDFNHRLALQRRCPPQRLEPSEAPLRKGPPRPLCSLAERMPWI